MNPEQLVLGLSIFFVFSTFIFSMWTLCKLIHKKTEASTVLTKSLKLITGAFLLWSFAEIIQFVLELMNFRVVENLADLPWTLGYLLIITGLINWLTYLYKKHDIDPFIPITGVLFAGAALGFLLAQPFIKDGWVIVFFIYPIFSTTLLLISLKLFVFLKDVKKIAIPLAFLSLNFLTDLAGDLMFNYGNTLNDANIILMSDSLFATGYIFSTIAFYLLSR